METSVESRCRFLLGIRLRRIKIHPLTLPLSPQPGGEGKMIMSGGGRYIGHKCL